MVEIYLCFNGRRVQYFLLQKSLGKMAIQSKIVPYHMYRKEKSEEKSNGELLNLFQEVLNTVKGNNESLRNLVRKQWMRELEMRNKSGKVIQWNSKARDRRVRLDGDETRDESATKPLGGAIREERKCFSFDINNYLICLTYTIVKKENIKKLIYCLLFLL